MLPAVVTPTEQPDFEERTFPELTVMEERFVHAYVASGGQLRASALKAGYAPTSAHVTASRLIRKPAVVRAVQAASTAMLGALVPAAVGRIARLGLHAKSEYIQLEASRDILDRAGLAAPKQVRVAGQLNVSFDLS